MMILNACFVLVVLLPPIDVKARTEAPPLVEVVRAPDEALQPRVLRDESGMLHMLTFHGQPYGGDLHYRQSKDDGATWSDAFRVNSHVGSAVAAGTIRGGQMALGKDGRVHVVWNGNRDSEPKPEIGGAPLLYTHLIDDSESFESERNVINRTTHLDGGGTVAADKHGNVHIIWHANEQGDTGEQDRRVWMASSSDGGETFETEKPIDARQRGACSCCGLNAFAGPDGRVHVLYRTADKVVNRDMVLLTSDSASTSFAASTIAPWEIGQCVMSSSTFDVHGDDVYATWEARRQVYFGRIDPDSGGVSDSFAAPGHGNNRKHPTIAANNAGQVLLVWSEDTAFGRGGTVHWQVFDTDGTPIDGADGHADDLPAFSFPTAFARTNGSFVVMY